MGEKTNASRRSCLFRIYSLSIYVHTPELTLSHHMYGLSFGEGKSAVRRCVQRGNCLGSSLTGTPRSLDAPTPPTKAFAETLHTYHIVGLQTPKSKFDHALVLQLFAVETDASRWLFGCSRRIESSPR